MAEFAVWQQNVAYPARYDRALVAEVFGEGVIDVSGGSLLVTERSAGANMSVDVAAGRCVVDGDEQADQETYLCVFDDAANLSVASADPDNPRIDRVIVRVQDSAVSGSSDGPVREVLTGTPAADPSAPAVPDSAISLATLGVSAGTNSITEANITDRRSAAGMPSAPPAGVQVFTANGTFTVPAYVRQVRITAVGAGGGGAGVNTNGQGGVGGGAGATEFQSVAVTPGNSVTVAIGSGGAGGDVGNSFNGQDGGATSTDPGPSANGGAGGSGILLGGAGGTGTIPGGTGDSGLGTDSVDVDAKSGCGGSSTMGGGGGSVTDPGASANGVAGAVGGGGSGGALGNDGTGTEADGGAGGDGVVIIEW